jgi:hypothetical protein
VESSSTHRPTPTPRSGGSATYGDAVGRTGVNG